MSRLSLVVYTIRMLRAEEPKSQVVNFRLPPSLTKHLGANGQSHGEDAREIVLGELRARIWRQQVAEIPLQAATVLNGDAAEVLRALPAGLCRSCVTSPPYWRQRDYGHPGQIGQESDPDVYIMNLCAVFTEVHRVLAGDGVLWVIIDDTYRHKQLVGIPWRLAFELQRRGWIWRSEIVWSKASLPEGAKDRPTRAHETVLMFTKAKRYLWNYEAMLEPHDNPWAIDCIAKAKEQGVNGRPRSNPFSKDHRRRNGSTGMTRAEMGALMNPLGRNPRDVWEINANRARGIHSATMPVGLAEKCIRASTKVGDYVLDPFCGVGTTGVAALGLGRRFVGVELVERFAKTAICDIESKQATKLFKS
jgi:DNA modification methylase